MRSSRAPRQETDLTKSHRFQKDKGYRCTPYLAKLLFLCGKPKTQRFQARPRRPVGRRVRGLRRDLSREGQNRTDSANPDGLHGEGVRQEPRTPAPVLSQSQNWPPEPLGSDRLTGDLPKIVLPVPATRIVKRRVSTARRRVALRSMRRSLSGGIFAGRLRCAW
jgi:hypothetical protein